MEKFLESIYTTKYAKNSTLAIYLSLGSLLYHEQYEQCDEILRQVDIKRLSTFSMRSFLVITSKSKDKLPYYQTFYDEIYKEMVNQKGLEETKKIIGNLK